MSPITWTVALLAGLTCVCGHGIQTDISSYPSLVQVEDRVGIVWLQQCVGSILTSYHILSSARCFADATTTDIRNRRIRAGTSDRGVGGIVKEVIAVRNHPTYGESGKDGDISVVRLESALTFGPNIAQAPIVSQGTSLPTYLPTRLASWGTTTEGGYIGNNYLYGLTLYTVDKQNCKNKYADEEITDNMFCLGLRYDNGRDLDSRDYGAPIFYDGIVIGVVSWGTSRGEDQYPIVNTAVGSYSQWIAYVAAVL